MKQTLFILALALASCSHNSKSHPVTMNAGATCTGSKDCKACKNCKYCKHCAKDGGTCGVCK